MQCNIYGQTGGGSKGIAPLNVKNLVAKKGNQKITICWEDPRRHNCRRTNCV